jgi:hypothetical protein
VRAVGGAIRVFYSETIGHIKGKNMKLLKMFR